VISLTPIASLSTVATRSLAVFDLDGTVAPNTVYLFWRHVWTNHPSAILSGPYDLPRTIQWLTNPKAVRRRLESIRETPDFEALVREFSESAVEKDIFVRSAEEIAWRRANLQAVVVVTGGFDAFAEPIYRRLRADRVHSNVRFMPMAVHGAKKPDILREYYFNEGAGFTPQAVYTDSHADRFMIEAFDWPEIRLVRPDRKLRRMMKDDWRVLNPNASNPAFPGSVREYASTVIRGSSPNDAALNFYRRWNARLQTASDPSSVERLNVLAVAGLYLREAAGVRRSVMESAGPEFEVRSVGLYARLIAKNPASPLPLQSLSPAV